jgi:hypothetical protein
MTQAFNLAQFANNLNTSGATNNAGLQNSAVTVTAGTGMSGGGSVALGSSVTLTNAGVTSVTAGTGISVSASTGGITITNSAPAVGGVTSLNGETGAITNTSLYAIGSYGTGRPANKTTNYAPNTTIAGSSLRFGCPVAIYTDFGDGDGFWLQNGDAATMATPSGTWRCTSRADLSSSRGWPGLWVRIS